MLIGLQVIAHKQQFLQLVGNTPQETKESKHGVSHFQSS